MARLSGTAGHRATSERRASDKRATCEQQASNKRAPNERQASAKRAPSERQASAKRAPSERQASATRAPSERQAPGRARLRVDLSPQHRLSPRTERATSERQAGDKRPGAPPTCRSHLIHPPPQTYSPSIPLPLSLLSERRASAKRPGAPARLRVALIPQLRLSPRTERAPSGRQAPGRAPRRADPISPSAPETCSPLSSLSPL